MKLIYGHVKWSKRNERDYEKKQQQQPNQFRIHPSINQSMHFFFLYKICVLIYLMPVSNQNCKHARVVQFPFRSFHWKTYNIQCKNENTTCKSKNEIKETNCWRQLSKPLGEIDNKMDWLLRERSEDRRWLKKKDKNPHTKCNQLGWEDVYLFVVFFIFRSPGKIHSSLQSYTHMQNATKNPYMFSNKQWLLYLIEKYASGRHIVYFCLLYVFYGFIQVEVERKEKRI